jgi:hypothetical protein
MNDSQVTNTEYMLEEFNQFIQNYNSQQINETPTALIFWA